MITELLILFMMLVFVTVVITQSLVVSRSRSLKARRLTEAVILAENTAEAASASDSPDELASLLGSLYEGSEVAAEPSGGDSNEIRVSGCSPDPETEDPGRLYDIAVIRTVDERSGGRLTEDVINIFEAGDTAGEPVYTLTAAHYAGEEAGDES